MGVQVCAATQGLPHTSLVPGVRSSSGCSSGGGSGGIMLAQGRHEACVRVRLGACCGCWRASLLR